MISNQSQDNVVPLPTEPPALARLLAYDLVTRQRNRLIPPQDSRLGALSGTLQLVGGRLVGDNQTITGFMYDSPFGFQQPLRSTLAAAQHVQEEALASGRIQSLNITIICLQTQPGPPMTSTDIDIPQKSGFITVIAADTVSGAVTELVHGAKGSFSQNDVTKALRHLKNGHDAPTLAAVGLAEQQLMNNGGIHPQHTAAAAARAVQQVPWVTYSLIASWVCIVILEQIIPTQSNNTLIIFGGLTNAHTGYNDWWRFFTSVFVHANNDPLDVGMNGLSMFFLGTLVERLYGKYWLLTTFFIGGLIGGLVYYFLTPAATTFVGSNEIYGPVVSIGASGGIMGLLGLLVMLGRFHSSYLDPHFVRSIRTQAIIWGALNIFIGYSTPGINNLAHLGGIGAGLIIGIIATPQLALGGKPTPLYAKVLGIALLGVTIYSFGFVIQELVNHTIF